MSGISVIVVGKRRTGKSKLIADMKADMGDIQPPGERTPEHLSELMDLLWMSVPTSHVWFYEAQTWEDAKMNRFDDDNNGTGRPFSFMQPFALIHVGSTSCVRDKLALDDARMKEHCLFVGTHKNPLGDTVWIRHEHELWCKKVK